MTKLIISEILWSPTCSGAAAGIQTLIMNECASSPIFPARPPVNQSQSKSYGKLWEKFGSKKNPGGARTPATISTELSRLPK